MKRQGGPGRLETYLAEAPPPEQLGLVRILRGHANSIVRLAWSPDGTRIGAVAGDAMLIWDGRTGALSSTMTPEKESTLRDFSWAPDGSRIAMCSDNRLTIIDSQTA